MAGGGAAGRIGASDQRGSGGCASGGDCVSGGDCADDDGADDDAASGGDGTDGDWAGGGPGGCLRATMPVAGTHSGVRPGSPVADAASPGAGSRAVAPRAPSP